MPVAVTSLHAPSVVISTTASVGDRHPRGVATSTRSAEARKGRAAVRIEPRYGSSSDGTRSDFLPYDRADASFAAPPTSAPSVVPPRSRRCARCAALLLARAGDALRWAQRLP